MRGVELLPASTIVRPYRSSMWWTYDADGRLAGLLVGARSDAGVWHPALDSVTVEAVIVHGRSLHIGPWQDEIADGDIGWPLHGAVSRGQSFVVYVRNDAPVSRELRAVVALQGDDVRRPDSGARGRPLQVQKRSIADRPRGGRRRLG